MNGADEHAENILPDKANTTARVEALSDAVFAVALTLLVLGIKVPEVSLGSLHGAMLALLPAIGAFVASFLIVGYAWIWHHLTFAMIVRSSRTLLWSNLFVLLPVGFLPFATALIARYPQERTAVLVYGLNFLWFSIALNLLLVFAVRRRLVGAALGQELLRSARRRGYLQTCLISVSLALGWIFPSAGIVCFALIPVIYIASGSSYVPISASGSAQKALERGKRDAKKPKRLLD